MDQTTFEEIVSILAIHGRPDLIADFKDNIKVDADFKPSLILRSSLSDTEGSAEEEEAYAVYVDQHGFHSLK